MNPFSAIRKTVAGFTAALSAARGGRDPAEVTRGDARAGGEGCGGPEGDSGPERRAVTFHVGGHQVVAEMPSLTPDDILRAGGHSPDAAAQGGWVLVRVEGTPVKVYGPADFNTAVPVTGGDRFEVWAAHDQRLHWYTLDGRRRVSLAYAVAPAAILRQAGYDPNATVLAEARDGGTHPILQDDRRPVPLAERRFVAAPR